MRAVVGVKMVKAKRRSERPSVGLSMGIQEKSEFCDNKRLPILRDLMSVLVHRTRNLKYTLSASAIEVIDKAFVIYQMARIPTVDKWNAVRDLKKQYSLWMYLKKFKTGVSASHQKKISEFMTALDSFYPLQHPNWEKRMKIEEDKQFLRQQMCPGKLLISIFLCSRKC